VVVVWISFLGFILVLLALDLGVFHRHARVVSVREALAWTLVWIATALAFAGVIYLGYDRHWLGMGLAPDAVDRSAAWPDGRINDARSAVLKFLTGYFVELSLSADNVFVIAMLFAYFGIPRLYQHRVLFWGILGALLMRGAMIAIGAQLVSRFAWILPVFGIVLIATAARMLLMGDEPADPGQKFLVRLMWRLLPISPNFHGEHFVVRRDARGASESRWVLTPLVPALVMVETTDLIFAVDSIPAIFAITADPFLVFTSNVFAILGLRSLYFALAGALHALPYLKHALAAVLVTVGVKMLVHSWLERMLGAHFNLYVLAAVLAILGSGVLVSLVELRWRGRVRAAVRSATRRLDEWVVPDDLISTISEAGQRAISRNASSVPHSPEPSGACVSPAARLWRRFIRGLASKSPVVVIHQIVEESEVYAAYLSGMVA
jgi:TerC family integral membrane protein